MIRIIIERRAKEGKQFDLLGELLEMRTAGMRQPGYVSGETLNGHDDPLLYVVISTWRSIEHWQTWTSSSERQKMAAKIERLLSTPEKTTILNFIEAG